MLLNVYELVALVCSQKISNNRRNLHCEGKSIKQTLFQEAYDGKRVS